MGSKEGERITQSNAESAENIEKSRVKILTESEIECLLGIQGSGEHPLDLLGYGYNSEGVQRFREEQPDFFPQIAAYVGRVLRQARLFPADTDVANPGWRTFIHADGQSYRISSLEEIGVSRYERITSKPLSETEAIREYVRHVANPDYIAMRG